MHVILDLLDLHSKQTFGCGTPHLPICRSDCKDAQQRCLTPTRSGCSDTVLCSYLFIPSHTHCKYTYQICTTYWSPNPAVHEVKSSVLTELALVEIKSRTSKSYYFSKNFQRIKYSRKQRMSFLEMHEERRIMAGWTKNSMPIWKGSH